MGMRILIGFSVVATYLSALVLPDTINAKQLWQIKQLDASQLPVAIVPDKRVSSINGLPDGKIATGHENGTIKKAWYTQPTRRYGHGILGRSE